MTSKLDRRALLWIIGIAAAATIVRILYIVEVSDHPLQLVATADPRAYDQRALEILRGQSLPEDVFFHSSPLYPYILAGIYALFGHSYTAVRAIQSAFGVATALLLLSISRMLFDRSEGIVAGTLSGLYVAFIFFDSELLMITLVVFFAVLALNLLLRFREKPRRGLALSAGLLMGLAALGKPNLLLFVPAVLVWFWWSERRATSPGDGARVPSGGGARVTPAGAKRVSPVLAGTIFLLGVVLPVAPATISNYRASGDFVLTTSNGGINFYIGNNKNADGTFLVDQSMRADLYEGSKRAAERRLGRKLTAGEVSSYWMDQGLDYVKERPAHVARLLGRKLLLFWNAYEIPNHYDINFFKTFSNVLRFNPFLFAWMIPFGFLGMYVSRRRWREHLLLYLFAGTYMISVLPFFVTSRYRLPIVPVMLVFAAHGVCWTWRRLRERERRGWAAPTVVLAIALVIVNLPLVDFTLGPAYASLGAVYRELGRHEDAATAFRRATEESPGYDLAFSNLGSELLRLGRYDEAENVIKRALELNPILVVAHANLGVVYTETGKLDQAYQHLMRAVQLKPEHKEAWAGLARLGMALGDTEMIETALLRTLELDPRDGLAHWNLAVLYCDDPAMRDRAVEHARVAASFVPDLRAEVARMLEYLQEGAER